MQSGVPFAHKIKQAIVFPLLEQLVPRLNPHPLTFTALYCLNQELNHKLTLRF
jgi:hypothetical protein